LCSSKRRSRDSGHEKNNNLDYLQQHVTQVLWARKRVIVFLERVDEISAGGIEAQRGKVERGELGSSGPTGQNSGRCEQSSAQVDARVSAERV
jgi:hypothetical protein